jgi:glycosyltransferase involved in cell wall biosynthesis
LSPPGEQPKLSVLICTLAHREAALLALLGTLLPQAEVAAEPVEVLALRNNGERTLFEFRQLMQDAARGEFICCVDDDDWVEPCYLEEICAALADPEVDVVGFEMESSSVGCARTYLSLRYSGFPWHAVVTQEHPEPAYYRDFNHLSVVRASIAHKGRWHIENPPMPDDQLYRALLVPHLTWAKEAYIAKVLYRYQWSPHDTNQAGGVYTPLAARLQLPEPGPRPEVSHPCFRWVEWQ